MTSKKNDACRYCNSMQLTKFLSLGEHPPSNSFISFDSIALEKKYPLEVYWCEKCHLVQLLDVVSPEIIFDDYLYLSSTSGALKRHYRQLADLLTERFHLQATDLVVDIGCNDGILLHAYSLPELVKVGVEPSRVAEIAKQSGLEVVKGFFNAEIAAEIVESHGKAKVVTATNVYPHVDDIGAFTATVSQLLDDDGVFVIEASYLLDLIDQNLFDTIYHEHLCYLSLTPMISFLAKHDIEVFDAYKIPFGASGPAFRVFMQKKSTASRKIEDSVSQMLATENSWGVGQLETYLGYAKKVSEIKADTLQILTELKTQGHQIGGYGAPAKGNTLLNYFGITSDMIECIAETNELKQGLVTPGSHIPIVSEAEFLKRMPSHALLLAWNYLDFFLEKSDYIRNGGKFVVPIPKPQIVP